MIQLVLPSDTANFDLRVTLDDVDFVLRFEWNQREEKWYLTVSDADEDAILSGVKVVADYPLLTLAKHDSRCPAGQLLAVDSSGEGLDPHFSDLSGETPRVLLMYVTASEVDA